MCVCAENTYVLTVYGRHNNNNNTSNNSLLCLYIFIRRVRNTQLDIIDNIHAYYTRDIMHSADRYPIMSATSLQINIVANT